MAQAEAAINTGTNTEPKGIPLDPEYKLLKCYIVSADKLAAFREFCKHGLPDANGGFEIRDGKPAEGVCKWLRDKGVKRADFWIFEEEANGQKTGATDPAEEESCLFVAAVDKYGLKGPDWSTIPGIQELLDPEYLFMKPTKLSDLGISDPNPVVAFFRKLFNSIAGQMRELINRVARVF